GCFRDGTLRNAGRAGFAAIAIKTQEKMRGGARPPCLPFYFNYCEAIPATPSRHCPGAPPLRLAQPAKIAVSALLSKISVCPAELGFRSGFWSSIHGILM